MIRNLVVALAAAAAVTLGGNAGAASISTPAATRTAVDSLKMTENVQFAWGGHDYCWYDDGWNGPGWYWCGSYLEPGIGWGGGYGWHHWRGGHAGGRGHAGGHAVHRGGHGGGHHGGRHGGGGHGGGGHGGGGHGGGGGHH